MKEIRTGLAILPLVATSRAAFSGGEHTAAGGALYLLRHGSEAHRAEFDYASDCRIVAKTMSSAEPQVEWYCDTRVSPVKFECSISGIQIRNLDSGEDCKIDIDFSLRLDRWHLERSL